MASSSSSSNTAASSMAAASSSSTAGAPQAKVNSASSSSILAPSKLSLGGGGSSSNSNSSSADTSAFGSGRGKVRGMAFPGFKESKLGSVVAKDAPGVKNGSSTKEDATVSSSSSSSTSFSSSSSAADSLKKKDSPVPGEVTPFLPLSASSASSKASLEQPSEKEDGLSNVSSSAGFVFGQNFSERVENFQELEKQRKKQSEADTSAAESSTVRETTSSSSSSSSSVVVASIPESEGGESSALRQLPTPPPKTEEGLASKSLSEAAAAYVESHQPKRAFEAPAEPQMTGEEDERNVCQLSAKLYVYDKKGSSWQERGRGTLRLNDDARDSGESRLVMRTAGTCRLILNTKLFRGMTVETPNEKNIRMTGYDEEGQVRVFLVASAAKDIAVLFKELKQRRDSLEAKAETTATTKEETVELGEGEVQKRKAKETEDSVNELSGGKRSKMENSN